MFSYELIFCLQHYYIHSVLKENPFKYLVEHPLFALRFVDQLIEDFLEEEIVPDFLIEFYRETESRITPEVSVYLPNS